MTYGLSYTVIPMYIGEIASDKYRGAMTILLTIMMKTGVLLAYVVGPYVSIRTMAWLSMIPPAMFLITIKWIPETPYYQLGRNRDEESFATLSKLRGHEYVNAELQMMSNAVRKSEDNNGTFKELFYTRGSRKALIILMGLTSIQILCGSQAIIAYVETIFSKVGTQLDASEVSIIFGSVQLASAAFAASIVDSIGRRPLLMTSVTGTAVCNATVGIFFLLEKLQIDVSSITWLPVLAMMSFIFFYVIGLSTVLFAVLGEIFPKNLKSVAGAVYTINSSILSFTVSKLFQVVSDGWGSDVTFLGFAFFGFLFVPFVWFIVPETKGKPLDSILEKLNSKNSKTMSTKELII